MIGRIILALVAFGATRAQHGCDSKADVTFLLDSSDNVGNENFKKQLNFVKDVTNNFQVAVNKVQVSAVTYGTGATNQFYLNQYRDKIALQNAIDSIQFKGGQNKMANAIRYATGTSFSPTNGGRADAPHVTLLLTNEPSGTIDMTKLESQTARDNGLILYTVGIGGAVDPAELMAIASNPDSRHMFTAQNFDALDSLSALLANKICNELPPDPSMLPAPTGCLQKADLVFMVDSSSSIGSSNFQKLEHFLKDVINKIDVGLNKVQVGVVKYASYPSSELSLGQYSTRPEVLKAIESMTYVGGGTNDADAIAFTANQVFSQNSGARADVPRIAVIITDGGSSNPNLAMAAANKARTQNIGLLAVGVGNGVNTYELNNLADKPSISNVFTVNSYDNLDTITDSLVKQMCTVKTSQPSLTGSTLPPDPCQDKMANCEQYGTNVCTDYKQWAGENCARTCGICTPLFTVAPPKCEDNFPNCASYGRDNCAVAGSFMQTNCKLFCGLCGSNTSSSGYYGKCSYKGKDYRTGETWHDGCDYECICEDGHFGRYKCNNRCPVYHDLPSDCTLVAQPSKCCLEPVCNFNPTVNTQVSSGHGKTASGIDVCVFKGKQYFHDQFWRDGCDYQCQCTNAKMGTYKCDDFCPTYNSIPPYCHLEKKAGECCAKPVCEFDSQVGSFEGYGSISGSGIGATPTARPPCLDALPNCNMYSTSVCFGTYRGWAAINCRKFCDMCPDGLPKPGPDDRCIFNGKLYSQGETWNTSCSTTCICENSIYGYYRCVDSCPTYNNIPSNCKTVKTAGQCCPTLRCDNGFFVSSQTNSITIGNGATFSVVNPPPGMIQVEPTLSTGEKMLPGTGTSGFTPPTLGGCLYKGQLYYQDQAWEDGCQYTCICKDANTGLFSCKEKCPIYPVLPPSCHLHPDPNDVCCKSPTCTTDPVTHQIPVPIPVFKPAVQTHGQVMPPTLNKLHNGLYTNTVTVVVTGFTPSPPTIGANVGTGGIGICSYRGQTYQQGQVWEDGCDFTCVCSDASRGHYDCTEKCVHYTNLPDQCHLIKDPSNPCCAIPKCSFVAIHITHIGELKTTTPRPLGEYCVYEGQRYQQGQTWYDGCSYKCTCEDATENVYRCLTRCPEYENVNGNCTFVPDPKDPSCCVMPECPDTDHTQSPTPELTPAPSGTFIGQTTGKGYCEYKSVHYDQDQKWQDGCDLTCSCTDAEAGFYRCSEACPRYVNIPEYCQLVTDFANPCCKKPRCTFPSSTGVITGTAPPTSSLAPTPQPPGQTPSPHVGPTSAPHYRYCLYKGVQYFQGETWEDGCHYKCRCDNADKGLYVCNQRCAMYDTVPETCTFVTDPEDNCCLVPSCLPATTPAPVPGSPTPSPGPYKIPTAAPGKVTGSANVPSPRPGVSPPPINYCEYKGRQYSQGQKWDDGCEFTCECIDEGTGKYQCLEKCTRYVNLPRNCRLVKDPAKPCCSMPECGGPTPAPPVTLAPSVTPTPTPQQHVCVYKGTSYTQGQTWYDGCDYECMCEDEMTGLYTCNDRCAQYGQLPPECTLVPSSADPLCCKEPKCTFQNTRNQTTGYLTPPTPPLGVISGGAATPKPQPSLTSSPGTPIGGPTPTNRHPVCVYKENEYQHGQRWNDGCLYTCICEDGMTGHYTCREMCSTYDDLPAGCRLVNDPYNPCCKKAYCPAKNVPTPAPPGQPSSSTTPKIGCTYNGVMFSTGQQWNDGCDLVCVCEDEVTGFYRCRDRCSKYDLAKGCTFVTDPRDSCCKVPYCSPVQPTPKPYSTGLTTYVPGQSTTPGQSPTPFPVPAAIPGVFQGSGVNGNSSGCVHYGVVYKQGDIWQDGCKYDCKCLDSHSGRYQCRERCSLFLNLPSYCRLVVDPKDPCCKIPACNTPAPTPEPTPGLAPTPKPKGLCVMNGKQYVAGQTWYMGCDQRCVCEDSNTGFYRCYDRCAQYNNISSDCTMVADPKDPTCCKVPQCIPVPGPGKTVPTDKPFSVTGVQGVVFGYGTPPPPNTGGSTPVPRNGCLYNGRVYTQGQKWQDGCTFDCICTDGLLGNFKCTERCAAFPFVPPECTMRRDRNDVCCFRPICDYNRTMPTPGPFPMPTPSPGATTITPLPPSYCVYKGVPYSQGQTWDDGCVRKCRCDDADMNIYTCFDRCKSYNTGPGCVMMSDPMDSCCQVPKCTKVPPTAGPTVCPYPMPMSVPGVISGGPQPDPVTGVALSNLGYCEYRGVQYQQGASWDDGCSYHCSCIDSSSGQYQCQERCPRYIGLPSYCKMTQDPNEKCCTKPVCDVCPSTHVPGVFTTSSPGPSQSQTPSPQPKNVCIMNGKQYKEGQKWFVRCDKICICDDGKTGTYSCTERCPSYPNTAGCTMVPDPRDPNCCKAPKCPGNTGVIGVVNGSGTPPPPITGPDMTGSHIPSTTPVPKVCVYKGKFYTQGQKWQDGCVFDCECLDADSGSFKCVDRCPRYPNLPSTCMLVYDTDNPCCQKPSCQMATPTPGPGQSPATIMSPTPEFCVYKGVPFRQGQKFNQGCDKTCVCENALTGKITCNDRCQTYPPLPINCTMVTDPKDKCCQLPNCFNPNTVTQTGMQGTFTGSNLPNTNNPYTLTGSRNVCVYNGKMYSQGKTWNDGCSYTCECLDAAKGLYRCTDKCQKFPPMPSYCRMVQDPKDKCCQTPLCKPSNPSIIITPGTITQPPHNMCVYKGNMYQQGQQWYDGCDFLCRCEDASANFYRCQQRCATYTKQTHCTLVPDPKDPTCCEIPKCPLARPGPSQSPGFVSPSPGGVIIGMGPIPSPGSTLSGSRRGCVYKGMVFNQGDKFDDGCDYHCECLDDITGKYKCVEKCQTFTSLPKYCTLIQDSNKPCCKVPYCDYGPNPVLLTQGPQLVPTPQPGVSTVAPYVTPNPPDINTTPRPSTKPSQTPKPTGYCAYKGVYYTQGQTWDDGCQLRCRCEDVHNGYYTCNQRCATYPASSCQMRADPMDACCLIPDCNTGKIPIPMPTPGPGQSTLNPTVTPEPITGTFTGNRGGAQPGTGQGTWGSRNICVYKSKVYTQGQQWQDGCSFNCECIDAGRGKYSCTDRCGKYPYLPAYCHWKQSSSDACCREPVCNTYTQSTTIDPPTTPTTQIIVTLAPADKCMYSNGTQYSQGATWNISCSVTCECIDSATNNFKCTDRCPVYSSLPSICALVLDTSDQCCMRPQCTLPTGVTLTPLTGYGPSGSAPPPTSLNVIPLGTHTVFTGYGKPKLGTVAFSLRDRCVYKGSLYTRGQSWNDGCTYVCTCEDQISGMYRCWNKCPTYPQLPVYCKSVSVPGQCCKSITCDIPGYGTYLPVPQIVATPLPPGATFPPTNSHNIVPPSSQTVSSKYPGGGYYLPDATNATVFGSIRDKCIYKSRLYNQGETWEDGCDFHCECLDQRAGYYACKPVCPVYNNLPSNKCYTVTSYGQCCSQPMCYDSSKGIAVNPLTSGKFPVVGTYIGGFSGFRPGYTGTNKGACIYKEKRYNKGQKWDDGCEFECLCLDDSNGLYQCKQKCPTYTNIPPLCKLESQPGSCCKKITCTQSTGGTLPPNFSTAITSSPQPQVDKDCYDRINNCKDYGKQACGSTYRAWAKRNCYATCFCSEPFTSPTPCIDKLNDCLSYGKSSCYGIYQPWAKDNCRKFCGYCPTGVQVITSTAIQTTAPPCGQCQDTLDTCAILDKSYYCTGSFRDWAIQHCQKTCGLCCVSIIQTTPKPTTPSPSSWLLFMKGVSGAPGPDLYQLWHSPQTINSKVPAAPHLTNEFLGHYKPDYSNHWKDYCIDQVKVSVYNNGIEKVFVVFNATGSDKNSWFTNDRIMYSTYTDIKTTRKDVMAMQGSASLGREFYISGHTSATDTCDSFGWMMISTKTLCPFEAADKKPTFYYAPGTTQAHWGFTNPLKGDVFAIQAHPTCFQSTSTPQTAHTAYCDYKGKQYTQGQYWQDGCRYNCTCEDATVGFYKCTDLCPKYSALPAGCSLVTSPGDCCAQPDCSSHGITDPPTVINATVGCTYKGNTYGQDHTWNDGCSSTCTCTDAQMGLFSCRGLCLTWNNLPALCHLDDAPPGLCCQQPVCPSNIIVTVPKGFEKQYPGVTVQSG